MKGAFQHKMATGTAAAALVLALCLPSIALAQRGPTQKPEHTRPASPARPEPQPQRSAPAPRYSAPALRYQQPSRQLAPSYSRQPAPHYSNGPQPTAPVPYQVPQTQVRPAYPGASYYAPSAPPASAPSQPHFNAPPGHLQSWLNEHRNVPVQNQQQMLRSDPSFKRLPPTEQQRLMQQLNSVNHLPEQQRERRLARAENLERLSPTERMRVTRSAREWSTLPADRQTLMRNAFRDLRSVPLNQRNIVLNSARYQTQFTPQERGILSDMLRVEPYEPAQ